MTPNSAAFAGFNGNKVKLLSCHVNLHLVTSLVMLNPNLQLWRWSEIRPKDPSIFNTTMGTAANHPTFYEDWSGQQWGGKTKTKYFHLGDRPTTTAGGTGGPGASFGTFPNVHHINKKVRINKNISYVMAANDTIIAG